MQSSKPLDSQRHALSKPQPDEPQERFHSNGYK